MKLALLYLQMLNVFIVSILHNHVIIAIILTITIVIGLPLLHCVKPLFLTLKFTLSKLNLLCCLLHDYMSYCDHYTCNYKEFDSEDLNTQYVLISVCALMVLMYLKMPYVDILKNSGVASLTLMPGHKFLLTT